MSIQEYVFRISVDADGVENPLGRVKEKFKEVDNAGGKLAGSFKVTAEQLKGLGYQTQDFISQVAGGQNVLLALFQQGGQAIGQFGGTGNFLRGIASLITPATVAMGAFGAAALGAVVAIGQGRAESDRLGKSLALTGNIAGVTAEKVESLATAHANLANATKGEARDAVTAVVSSGQFGAESLNSAIAATLTMQRVTGQAADEIVKDYASMRQGVAQWAYTHNSAYNYLSAAQYKHIQQLEAQGKVQQAMDYNLRILGDTMGTRMPVKLNSLGEALKSAEQLWSRFWDAAKGVGRADTAQEEIAKLQSTIGMAQRLQENAGGSLIGRLGAYLEGRAREDMGAANRTFLNAVESQAQATAAAMQNAKELEEAQRGHESAMIDLARAGANKMLADQQAALDQQHMLMERAWARNEVGYSTYTAAVIAEARKRTELEIAQTRKAIEIEGQRTAANPEEVLAQKARRLDLEAKLVEQLQRRRELEDKIRAGELNPVPKSDYETPNQQFRRFEHGQDSEIVRQSEEAKQANADLLQQLRDQNRQLGVDLIRDDTARGMAQIALEEEQIRKRLHLEEESAASRKLIEEELAAWRVNRERLLTEQLKPEWQRQIEAWDDAQLQMKRSRDEFMNGWVDQGRDAFSQFLRTGKRSIGSLVDYARDQFAKMVFDRYLSKQFASAGEALFGNLFGAGFGFDPFGTPITAAGGPGLVDLGLGGGRANGGDVTRGTLYQVNERGDPEILSANGKDYLMMSGRSGRVTAPARSAGAAVAPSIVYSPTIYLDATADRQATLGAVQQLQQAHTRELVAMLRDKGAIR
ncbi:phage tail length tape measure family protein [Paucibacter sp. APW11]|uniref:Phage tail length tape measure family protein n=1 Tax=Roseateles aquae TaxID=3077235 RepID=A0ABU3P8D7_9BURK|nr:phage tail length tape measure family protein [Paucibacter sp. APW11]MDT8998348.1 phage tail length tape measure family protein [Paucibacter sp. APW11]